MQTRVLWLTNDADSDRRHVPSMSEQGYDVTFLTYRDLLQQVPNNVKRYDVAVIDPDQAFLQMYDSPERDQLDALIQRLDDATIPRVVVSGWQRRRDIPAREYMGKPLQEELLIEALRKVGTEVYAASQE
jgi:hypothetical protein